MKHESLRNFPQLVLATEPSAVVPAQVGTHNHQGFGHRWPSEIALLRGMGRRLRGDDNGWVRARDT
jgi:hypothetical protein